MQSVACILVYNRNNYKRLIKDQGRILYLFSKTYYILTTYYTVTQLLNIKEYYLFLRILKLVHLNILCVNIYINKDQD